MDQYLYKLKDNVSDELKKIAESGLTKTNLDTAHKLVNQKGYL